MLKFRCVGFYSRQCRHWNRNFNRLERVTRIRRRESLRWWWAWWRILLILELLLGVNSRQARVVILVNLTYIQMVWTFIWNFFAREFLVWLRWRKISMYASMLLIIWDHRIRCLQTTIIICNLLPDGINQTYFHAIWKVFRVWHLLYVIVKQCGHRFSNINLWRIDIIHLNWVSDSNENKRI